MPMIGGVYYPDDEETTETPVEPTEPETPETPPSIPITPVTPAKPKPITQSILLTVKKMLGVAEEYHAFDLDIITNINMVMLTLNQLRVGPRLPFQITGEEETWADFLGNQLGYFAGVQSYVYMKVRLIFDTPSSSAAVTAMTEACSELEWRFLCQPSDDDWVEYEDSFLRKPPTAQNGTPEEETPAPPAIETPDETEEEAVASTFSLRKPSKQDTQAALIDMFR